MRRYVFGSVILLLLAPASQAGVIDFETLADLEVVDNQFLTLGADFNGTATALLAGVSLNPDFPPYSGNAVVYNERSSGIRVDSVGQRWAFAGGYITGNTSITLSAYNSGGLLLGSVSTGGANQIGAGTPNLFLSLTAPPGDSISWVTFADSGVNTFTLDDFSFNSVPEPSTLLLLGAGLAGLGVLRRRHT